MHYEIPPLHRTAVELLYSRKKLTTDEAARDLTEWVGRAGPTGDDTVVNSRKNTR